MYVDIGIHLGRLFCSKPVPMVKWNCLCSERNGGTLIRTIKSNFSCEIHVALVRHGDGFGARARRHRPPRDHPLGVFRRSSWLDSTRPGTNVMERTPWTRTE